MNKYAILTAVLASFLAQTGPASAQSVCTNPTSPAGHALCLGIPDGPNADLGMCLGGTGATCDPLNRNHAKFSTVGVLTSPTRIDYYFVAHNNRIFHNYQNPVTGHWGGTTPPTTPPASAIIREFDETPAFGHGALTTVGLGTVLHQNTVTFDDPATTHDYNYAMYMVYQFDPDQGTAGHACVSFSDNGVSGWSPPIRVIDTDMALDSVCLNVACDSVALASAHCKIPVEAISGFLLPDPQTEVGTALLAGLEGHLVTLSCETYESDDPPKVSEMTNLTSLYRVTTDLPQVVENLGFLPVEGMNTPSFPANLNNTGRFHQLFINLDMVYDPHAERIMLSRVYPFPFDHHDESGECGGSDLPWSEGFLELLAIGAHDNNAPCDVGFYDRATGVACTSSTTECIPTCPTHVGTLPMRGQIYSKTFRGKDIDSVSYLLEEDWTLDFDLGRSTGWSVLQAGNCSGRFPVTEAFQRDIGVDVDSLTFLRTPEGWIPEANADIRTYLGGYIDRNDACQDYDLFAGPTLDAHEFTIDLARVNLFSDGFENGTVNRWNGCLVTPLPDWCTNID